MGPRQSHEPFHAPRQQVLAVEPVSHFAYAPSNAPRSGPRSQSRPHRTTLSVRRTSVLGKRYIEKPSSHEAVRRRMISGRFRCRGRGPTKSLLRHHDLQKLDCRLLMYDRMTY